MLLTAAVVVAAAAAAALVAPAFQADRAHNAPPQPLIPPAGGPVRIISVSSVRGRQRDVLVNVALAPEMHLPAIYYIIALY